MVIEIAHPVLAVGLALDVVNSRGGLGSAGGVGSGRGDGASGGGSVDTGVGEILSVGIDDEELLVDSNGGTGGDQLAVGLDGNEFVVSKGGLQVSDSSSSTGASSASVDSLHQR